MHVLHNMVSFKWVHVLTFYPRNCYSLTTRETIPPALEYNHPVLEHCSNVIHQPPGKRCFTILLPPKLNSEIPIS